MNKLILFLLATTLSLCSYAQDASIFFQVNLSYQIQLGNFNPEEEFVDIAGTFNDWGEDLTPLTDLNNDSIYEVTVSDFIVGEYIEFKFRYNGVWDGREEFPGTGNNRVHVVETTQDSLYFWYNNELPPYGPPAAGFSAETTEIKTGSTVHFQNLSGGNVLYYNWHFEGGSPEASGDFEPSVFYHEPGSFDVQLIAGNDNTADTMFIEDYITVTERDTSQIDWWNNTVFYEIFVRSFYDSDGDGIGDFNGLTQKLDYLNDGNPETDDDLGITGIWLMPVNPSPSYHGYDVTDYTAINPDYGTMEEFTAFLEAAHERGIKVIIDYVMNHSSSEHPWFISAQDPSGEYRDYYRWSQTNPGYPGPWGQQVWHYNSSGFYYGIFWGGMPDLNYETQEVKEQMFGYAAYWLNEVGVDGFRLDAVKYIFEDGPVLEDLPQTFQFWKDFSDYTKAAAPNSFTVGEAWTSTLNVINYVENDRLDICFEFDLAGSILNASNTATAENLRGKTEEVYNVYPHLQWGTFLTNHDMDRTFNVLGMDEEKNKLAAAIYLTLPGVPFIYYGEEIGMLGEGPHPDIRRPMQWSPNANAGFTSGIPWHSLNYNYAQYNVETEQADPSSILNRYRKMINIRNLKPALRTGNYIEAGTDQEAVFSFIRTLPDDTAIVAINTASGPLQDVEIDLSATGLADDSFTFWDMMEGEYETFSIDEQGMLMLSEMAGYEVNIWSYDLMSSVNEPPSVPKNTLNVYPNPVRQMLNINANRPVEHVRIFDLTGRPVFNNTVTTGIFRLNMESFKPGVYIIRIKSGEGVFTERIVVR